MLPAYTSLHEYALVRDAVLARVTNLLAADTRVAAAWLAGSFGRGEADAWADLDLHVAVFDARFDSFLAERPTLYRQIGAPILIQEEMPGNAQPGSVFQLVVYPGPVEIDWNIGPLSRAVRALGHAMLVERVAAPLAAPPALDAATWRVRAEHWLVFFWAMAQIAVKYVGRGQTYRAVAQVALLSRAYIALWRLLHEQDGPEPLLDWTNQVIEPDLDAELPQLGPQIDPLAALTVIEALCAGVERFHPSLVRRGIDIPAALPAEVQRLAALARRVALHDAPSKRPYR